jgi:hypothetical protein
MKKDQVIILVVCLIILIGGISYFSLFKKAKVPPKGEVPETKKEIPEAKQEEIFTLTAKVSKVDPENNFLIVTPVNSEKAVKVILSTGTELIKLELPFDPKNPPKEATFTPKKTEITIKDFKEGNNIFIKTLKNIAGKTEFDDVDFIQIFP